jgi:hypothetical protein
LLNSVGIDRGRTSEREISVNIFTGSPTLGVVTPTTSQHVALPSSGLTFRRLFLPRASKAVRQQVMAEELSYSLPFPLSDAHYGSVERGEEAWVAVASDAVVAPVKDLYPRAALEVEPLCYLRAARAARLDNVLVVDFGASKTVFCGLENGTVGNVRVLLRGGERLTETVMEATGLSRDKAELFKREQGVDHQTIRQFYLELIEEALLPHPLPYRNVLICGGGSATPGLLKLLSERYGSDVDVEPFPLPGQLLATDHVVAYGAALAGRPNALRLQMDQSQRQVRGDGGEPLAWGPLVMVTLLMAFMAVSTETRLRGAEKKEKMMRASLVDAISPVVPNAKDLPSEQLVKALRDQLAKQKAVARSSPARLMNTLGKGAESVINKEGAYLNLVTFEDGKLKWEGYTKTLKDSEDVRLGLEKVMDEVEQVRTRPSRDGFVFQIEGKPRDS